MEGVLKAVGQLGNESEMLSGQSAQITPLRLICAQRAEELSARAKILSKKRQIEGGLLACRVEEELKLLGMPHCRFRIQFSHTLEELSDLDECDLTADGFDAVTFLISPNPGEGFKDLARIASGGELSRFLLAIKSAIIENDPVETYIFDEVDTGISGGTAQIVGQKLQRVGIGRQALCITHLAQVAACAHQHLFVSKCVSGDRTSSQLRFLSMHERVEEIARMLGGIEITERTRAHAQELLQENGTNHPVLAVVS
jgi:DNA repair protein RecN (Recombination protein N)